MEQLLLMGWMHSSGGTRGQGSSKESNVSENHSTKSKQPIFTHLYFKQHCPCGVNSEEVPVVMAWQPSVTTLASVGQEIMWLMRWVLVSPVDSLLLEHSIPTAHFVSCFWVQQSSAA